MSSGLMVYSSVIPYRWWMGVTTWGGAIVRGVQRDRLHGGFESDAREVTA
jgi:hypothetical protein